MGTVIFCDTYALYEFIGGNKRYKDYFENNKIVITKLNQIELFYRVLREFGLEKAREYYFQFEPFVEEIDYKIVEKSMLFRIENKKRELSYADCVGYAFSLLNNMKFLTGDKEFKDIPNVEFVK